MLLVYEGGLNKVLTTEATLLSVVKMS